MQTDKKTILGCFQHGADGYKAALMSLVEQRLTIPTIGVRHAMLARGMGAEIHYGTKLTSGPSCTARVKKELGLKKISKQKTLDLWMYLMNAVERCLKYERVVYEGEVIMSWNNNDDSGNIGWVVE